MVIILRSSYRLPLPVGSFIIFTQPVHLAADRLRGEVAAGTAKRQL
jgi:hypothetical protein